MGRIQSLRLVPCCLLPDSCAGMKSRQPASPSSAAVSRTCITAHCAQLHGARLSAPPDSAASCGGQARYPPAVTQEVARARLAAGHLLAQVPARSALSYLAGACTGLHTH